MTRAESNLLTVARVAVGVYPAQDATRLLVAQSDAPSKLGPTARGVLSDTLGRGVVAALARRGGWLEEGGQRLWQRYPAPPLRFTSSIIRLFRWMLSQPLVFDAAQPLVLDAPLTLAEQVVVLLLFEQLRGTGCDAVLAAQPALRSAPLIVLAHAAELALLEPVKTFPTLEVESSAVVLEGLRHVFASAWLAGERLKREQSSPRALTDLGRAQTLVLTAFLDAIDRAGQRQLATFLVDAAVTWLATPRTVESYVRNLSRDASLRERTEARRQAAAFLRALERLRTWDREHRAVRFIDDGYEVAQRLVKDWERLGERGFTEAARLVAELDAIPTE